MQQTRGDKQVITLLARAQVLLQSGHCQHADAMDTAGRKVPLTDPSATSWCITAALLKAARDATEKNVQEGSTFIWALNALASAMGFEPSRDVRDTCEKIWAWEDMPGRSLVQVMKVFETAKQLGRISPVA